MKQEAYICHFPIVLMLCALLALFGCKKADTTVTDADGNVYHTVTIGKQTWMAENLKTTKYRNGEPIPCVSGSPIWDDIISGAYCDYDNDTNSSKTYGRLYNWYAVVDKRNIAPPGWHVPTAEEWKELTTYLGGDSIAGRMLKEKGAAHWKGALPWHITDTSTTNETGFTALPGGWGGSSFCYKGIDGNWWSSSEGGEGQALLMTMTYDRSYARGGASQRCNAFSVRCVMD